jgi:hypothetical protein
MSDHKIFMNSTLGFDVPVKVPFSTTEEYDRLTGTPGSWWEAICAKTCYSNYNTAFGNKLVEKLVAITGVPVPTIAGKMKKIKGGEEVPEEVTPKKYFRMLVAEGKVTLEQVSALALQVAEEMPVLRIEPATSTSSKLEPLFLSKGQTLLAQLKAAGKDLDDYVARFIAKFPGAPELGDEEEIDATYLGRLAKYKVQSESNDLL